MTDRFEEAVRQAAQGLSTGAGADMPGYHDSWKRGRRRRVVKQAGFACVGALALVVAIGVNAGRFDSPSVDVTDVASDAAVATLVPEQTLPPTTSPLDPTLPTVTPVEIGATDPLPAADPTSTAVPSTPTITAVEVAPTPTPAQPASVPAEVVEPTPTPAVPPTVTPVPPTPVPATPEPTTTPEPAVAESTTLAPTPTPTAGITTDAPPQVAGTESPDPDLSAATKQGSADATLLGEIVDGSAPCDTTADGTPDSSCQLFPRYACTTAADALLGYDAVDTTGDSNIDSCVATTTTTCDFTGDGLPDVSCVVTPDDPLRE